MKNYRRVGLCSGYGRWNQRFDAHIALTFARGQEFDHGSRYALFDTNCRERFRVVVNPRAFRGVEFRPQGIVTAYETNWPNSSSWTGMPQLRDIERTACSTTRLGFKRE